MPTLYGPKGEVLKFKKEKSPRLGNVYADSAGRDLTPFELPGGGLIQFDLSRLRLSDFRQMATHYQVNSSLNLLAFMQHQARWQIRHSEKKVRDLLTENLKAVWTQLCRVRAQANWAGFSPSVIDWDNYYDGTTRITKFKDLLPEECLVNWKEIDGYAPPNIIPPKIRIYDGIKKYGQSFPIPVENTFWFPILMENHNYYGRKLLKSVYTSYFFSMLIHLYANRYYERFGEPTPVGRAPFDDDIQVEGATVSGHSLMKSTLSNLRSRGVVVLPSDKTLDSPGHAHYDYDIEYLETQMRGADFERILARYDQEMALGTFTPLLLQQTSDVGSYNLGGLHFQMYLLTQNAMNADFAMYVNNYILRPLQLYNFAKNNEPAYIEFEQQDNQKMDLVKMIIQAMVGKDKVTFDLDELGQAAGMTIKEIRAVTTPRTIPPTPDPSAPDKPPVTDPAIPAGQTPDPSKNAMGRDSIRAGMFERVRNQVFNAMRDGSFGPDTVINIPFTRQLAVVFGKDKAEHITGALQAWCRIAVHNPWPSSEHFAREFCEIYDEAV